nr:hypothetical protein [uncultured Lachnoclostridium sp.]
MKKTIFTLLMGVSVMASYAQTDDNDIMNYRRSSLYSLMINHTDQQFAGEIKEAFLQIPVPDKFNNHDLSVKVLNLDKKLEGAKSDKENPVISEFLKNNNVASRLVARWFNRDMYTGNCNMDLVKERGLYNATEFDLQLAKHSARGMAMLQDAGEELIGNTFVVVNDIRYIDKNKGAKTAGLFLRALGQVAAAATGNNNFGDLGNSLGDITETLKGFTVKINTFLYRLEWDKDKADNFYRNQYGVDNDEEKKENFDKNRGCYSLKYVGKVESKGGTTSFLGIKEDEPVMMVRKACQRAIDENVADLQRSYEEFRAKTPLVTVDPLTAYIGKKEGITSESRFEVLEVVEMEDGTHKYNKVGEIQPVEGQIWDNRFMAEEEGAAGSNLKYTTFRTVSGKDFAKGMLIREICK